MPRPKARTRAHLAHRLISLSALAATLVPMTYTEPAGSVWPLEPRPVVIRPFVEPSHRYGPGHRGADLLGLPGQAVLASRPGRVAFAGSVAGVPVVTIEHSDGLRTTYQPVASGLATDTVVSAGDTVGNLVPLANHCSPLLCLHWGLHDRIRDIYLDPLLGLERRRVVLLPLLP